MEIGLSREGRALRVEGALEEWGRKGGEGPLCFLTSVRSELQRQSDGRLGEGMKRTLRELKTGLKIQQPALNVWQDRRRDFHSCPRRVGLSEQRLDLV